MLVYSAPRNAETIPILDLEGCSTSAKARQAVALRLHEACRDIGFFYIANHGVSEALLKAQLASAMRFFALPDEPKLALSAEKSPRRLGYEPMLRQVLDEGSAPDLKESFMYSLPAALPMVGEAEIWPTDLPGFDDQMTQYQHHMRTLGGQLMELIALSLELPENYFKSAFADAAYAVRLLRYPPQSAVGANNQLGAGAHTDWGAITLLYQDHSGGLEVRNAAGQWLRAQPIINTFVVNLGDLMRRWTNDFYQSTPHRVLNNTSGHDRYSVATFCSPGYSCRIECLPTCLPRGTHPRYAACTVGEHLREMATRTYDIPARTSAPGR
jgi:isopenicillin N synthase-like dioxygenase